MPKRDRDGDDIDTLDLDEMKEIHKAAILREADLTARVAKLEKEKKEEAVKSMESCCFLFIKSIIQAVNLNLGAGRYYPNPLLPLLFATRTRWDQAHTLRSVEVSSCSEIAKMMEEGVTAGTTLLLNGGDIGHSKKFVQVVVCKPVTNKDVVVAGEESCFAVLGGYMGSHFNQPFADYLYKQRWKTESKWLLAYFPTLFPIATVPRWLPVPPGQAPVQRVVDLVYHLVVGLSDGKILSESTRKELSTLPYNGQKETWVATLDDPEAGIRCDVNLDEMTVTSKKDGSVRRIDWQTHEIWAKRQRPGARRH